MPHFHQSGGSPDVAEIPTELRSCEYWRPSVGRVRDAMLGFRITAVDWRGLAPIRPEGNQFVPAAREVENVCFMCEDAVRKGRMIDFGWLPNDVIKQGGIRGGPLWDRGYLGQPFRAPWILYHRWDHEADDPAVAVLLINPMDETHGPVEICELQPMRLNGADMLVICDRGLFEHNAADESRLRYNAIMAPSQLRFSTDEESYLRLNGPGKSPGAAAAGNIGDPLMTALLMLNTRGVPRETIVADAKLNAARIKNRKPPIPPYDVVHSEGYVTAVLARKERRERAGHGGTHASPHFHLRMGHPRNYASGKSVFIADTLVNASEEAKAAFRASRSHYRMR